MCAHEYGEGNDPESVAIELAMAQSELDELAKWEGLPTQLWEFVLAQGSQ
jgi:hypothetical protein